MEDMTSTYVEHHRIHKISSLGQLKMGDLRVLVLGRKLTDLKPIVLRDFT